MSKVSISGFPALASETITWSMISGTKPFQIDIPFKRKDAESIVQEAAHGNGQFELDINGKIYKRLFVLTDVPGQNQFIKKVRISDRRWIWQKKHVLRRYNVPRRVGFRNLTFNADAVPFNDVNPDFYFAAYSLKDPEDKRSVWAGSEILTDVMDAMEFTDFRISNSARKRLDAFPVENLILDDPGDEALQRILAKFPSVDVYIDPDGNAIFYDTLDTSENGEVARSQPEVVGGGHVEFITGELERPKEIHVLFTREIETRFDFQEVEIGDTETIDEFGRTMHNVIPVPDFEIEVPITKSDGSVEDTTISQGTYVRFDDYINAITELGPPGTLQGVKARKFFQIIRQAMVPGLDLWGPLNLTGIVDQPDVDWAARISAIQQHYRRTYRINREWIDRILELKPYLVGTIDIENGTRGPAQVFGDYTLFPTQKYMFSAQKREIVDGFLYAISVEAFDGGDLDQQTKIMPATIRIEDQDQGIIQIDPRVDPWRQFEQILPSKIDNIPRADSIDGLIGDPITFDSASRSGTVPELSANYQLAILLTSIPASPNSKAQLQRVKIKPQEVEKRIGITVGPSFGPILEVRLSASLETARVAWSDEEEDKEKIESAFGIKNGKPVNIEEEIDLENLTINFESSIRGGEFFAGSLTDIATAVAAQIWINGRDRFLGSMTSGNVNAQPAGSLKDVSISVDTDGGVLATLDLPETPLELNLNALLPDGTRQVINKEIR